MSGVVECEVAVVGAGVMGSWAALHLAQAGVNTFLLEQYSANHRAGSSHGLSRITRRVYAESYYVEMMDDAFKEWERLEQETKTKLYIPTGILMFGERNVDNDLESALSSLKKCGVPYEEMSGEEAVLRYPGLRLPKDFACLLEKDGGILLADKARATVQNHFKSLGGTLLENHKVVRIEPGERVILTTSRGRVIAKRVVLTPGGWGRGMLAQLGLDVPLQPKGTEVLYWKVQDPNSFSAANFPVLWYTEPRSATQRLIYGLPAYEYPHLIKVCVGHTGPKIDSPDEVQLGKNQVPFSVEMVSEFVAQFLNGVCTTPSEFDTCVYTVTPDGNPVIDHHPQHRNIVFAVGFSGHGFKESPAVGKLLCQLVMDSPRLPTHLLRHFSLSRFTANSHL